MMINNKEINLRPDFSAHFKEKISKQFNTEETSNSIPQDIFSISKSFKKSLNNLSSIAILTSIFLLFSGSIGIVYLFANYASINIVLLFFRLFFFSMFFLSGVSLYSFARKVKDVINSNSQDAINFQLKQFFDGNTRFLIMLGLAGFGLFLFTLLTILL